MNEQNDDKADAVGKKIGIADTMFARGDMGSLAVKTIQKNSDHTIERYTVPGVKDLPVACRRLFKQGCDIVIACGYIGGAPVDEVCGHEASTAIQSVQLKAKKHIIEVFVHENEGTDAKLAIIMKNRVEKHALNAIALLESPNSLQSKAGSGERQGWHNARPLNLENPPADKTTLGIIVGEFNKEITLSMKDTAEAYATEKQCSFKTIQVPGVFDFPLIIRKLMKDRDVNAIVLLGAVIKGETDHDDVIARTVADVATNLSLQYKKPIGFGILGPNISWEQAESRGEEYAKRSVDAALRLLEEIKV